MGFFDLNQVELEVPWEKDLKPGPVGEYLEVIDIDPPGGCAYVPVDLNHPALLAQSGYRPTQGNPQFHQQMVYAVAMKTIDHFEKALGRVALWAPRIAKINGKRTSRFVRRLRIYPHALREANAYYSPEKCALLFGYFRAADEQRRQPAGWPGVQLPVARRRRARDHSCPARRAASPIQGADRSRHAGLS